MKEIKFIFFSCVIIFFTSSTIIFLTISYSMTPQIAVIVNGNVITNYDIDRRTALLRLQKKTAQNTDGYMNLNILARNELIDEMLRRVEMKNQNISISEAEVDMAFAGFAKSNNMTVSQLDELLVQADITTEHFKSYINSQIGWGQLISKRLHEEGEVSLEEAVQRMLRNGGVKPSVKEYLLHQIIFVVPQNQRAELLKKRMQEANTLRKYVDNCETLEEKTKGIIDVVVRNLGHVLELQLPERWRNVILSTAVNRTTPVLATERGAEFLVVCSIRKVSNDRVAQLFFSMKKHSLSLEKLPIFEKKYMQELYKKAKIQFY